MLVELLAYDTQAQLLIREMIEDTPSSVAHSVHKRILHKNGLLFLVRLGPRNGSSHATAAPPAAAPVASPELISRASVVL